MVYELDAKGRYLGDAPDGEEGLTNWTREPMPEPIDRPYFVGNKLSTGEWVGEWKDDGPAPLTTDQIKASERAWRDAELWQVDFQINRLNDAGEDARQWREYRQALRDYPESVGFSRGVRPSQPLIP